MIRWTHADGKIFQIHGKRMEPFVLFWITFAASVTVISSVEKLCSTIEKGIDKWGSKKAEGPLPPPYEST